MKKIVFILLALMALSSCMMEEPGVNVTFKLTNAPATGEAQISIYTENPETATGFLFPIAGGSYDVSVANSLIVIDTAAAFTGQLKVMDFESGTYYYQAQYTADPDVDFPVFVSEPGYTSILIDKSKTISVDYSTLE